MRCRKGQRSTPSPTPPSCVSAHGKSTRMLRVASFGLIATHIGACTFPHSFSPSDERRANGSPTPEIVMTSPAGEASLGGAVTLTAQASDPDGDPLEFLWTQVGGSAAHEVVGW